MNKKNMLTYLIFIIIILILIAINLSVFIKNNYKKIATTNETSNVFNDTNDNVEINTNYETTSKETDEENRTEKISSLSEQLRMETYFGQYISLIEKKDYASAYELLYDGFKQSYFPTIEDFTTYAQTHYPNNIVVEYTDIDREGTIFILKVKIRNPLTDTTETEVPEQQVVIIEESVNNFKLSFAVNE